MMIPEKMFQQILALGEAWRVAAVEYVEKQSQVVVRVEETAQLWAGQRCPHCASSTVSGYDHAPERRWRHLNVCQLTTEIACALPRGQCRECRKVFTVRAPWEGRGKHFTQEYEAFALLLMREMPVARAGEILGETDQRLWRVLFAHVQAARAELTWAHVVWVGADEMNRRKGHHYLTVFVDLEAKRVLLAVEGKDASVWERFAEEVGRHNGHPKAITQVAIDMSPAYVKGVRENLGNAAIVFDKFHVLSHGVQAVDEVRRAEARGDAAARAQLEKTHWLWRKNPERWTPREGQRWESLREQPLVTGLAYAMRLGLQNVYRCTTVAQARRKLADWCAWVRASAVDAAASLLAPMVKVVDMVERHLEGILGHWQDGLTTAFLEGLNSLFSATKRKARGYRCSEYQIAMLYFVAGKLRIPCY
jgi:transposase